jgi:hypothetical protein
MNKAILAVTLLALTSGLANAEQTTTPDRASHKVKPPRPVLAPSPDSLKPTRGAAAATMPVNPPPYTTMPMNTLEGTTPGTSNRGARPKGQ